MRGRLIFILIPLYNFKTFAFVLVTLNVFHTSILKAI